MTHVPSERIAAFIRGYEQCRLKAYKPTPNDVWTCGWGATTGVTRDTVWTQAEADARFARDLERFGNNVAAHLGSVPTTQGQYDAMVSFSYNVGIGAFAESTLLRKHRDGDTYGAALEFSKWTKQAGIVLKGLVSRRKGEAAIYSGVLT